jgi:hypothetical protein
MLAREWFGFTGEEAAMHVIFDDPQFDFQTLRLLGPSW